MVSVDGKASQAMNSKLHKAFIVFLSVFTLLLIFPVVSVQAHIPKDTHDQFLSRNCSSFVGVTGNVAGARTASRNTSFLTRKHRIRQEATTARIGRDADKTLSGNTLNVGNKSTVDIDRITSASRKTAKRSTFTHTPGPRPQFNTDGLTEIQLAKLAKRRPDLLPQGFTPKPRALLPEASSSKKGLYVLESGGKVKYVGIGNTAVRGGAHANDPLKAGLKQRVLFDTGTLTNAQARGLEAKLMGKLGGPQSANPNTGLLNKIRSFSSKNRNRSSYRKAVTKDMWKDTLNRLKDNN